MPRATAADDTGRSKARAVLRVAVALGSLGLVFLLFAATLPAAIGPIVGVGATAAVAIAGVVLGRGDPVLSCHITTYLAAILTVTAVFLVAVWVVVFVMVALTLGGVVAALAATGLTLGLAGLAALVFLGALVDGSASTSWALNLRMTTAILMLALCTVVAFALVWGLFLLLFGLAFSKTPPAALAATLVTIGALVVAVYREIKQTAALENRADAEPVTREAYPELYARVTRIAKQLDVPVPTVAISQRAAPEAMVVGFRPSQSHLVLSTGTLEAVEDAELDAVIAHELAHVANRDAMVMTAVSTPVVFLDSIRAGLLGGVTSVAKNEPDHGLSEEELWGEDGEWRLTDQGPLESREPTAFERFTEAGPGESGNAGVFGWLVAVVGLWSAAVLVDESGDSDGLLARLLTAGAVVLLLLTWLVSRIIVAVFSRARETAADRTAAEVTGSPAALAGALRSLDERIDDVPTQDLRDASGVSSLSILPLDRAMFGDTARGLPDPPAFVGRLKRRLFGTHPPVEQRLEDLSRLEARQESE